MYKCAECLCSRMIVSENGYHAVCGLSQKKACDCIMGKKSYFATVKQDDSEVKVMENKIATKEEELRSIIERGDSEMAQLLADYTNLGSV